MEGKETHNWESHISIVDSSLSEQAVQNVEKVDTEMLVHMNHLQDLVQNDLTKFQPVIVAQFTPGGGKFTLLRNEYHNESRKTVEPVSNLFAMAKSIAHAPLGIYGCFGPYATTPLNQDWRIAVKSYENVLTTALDTFDNIKRGFQIDEELKTRLVKDLNEVTGNFDGASPDVTEDNVVEHIHLILKKLLVEAIDFIKNKALALPINEAPTRVFQEWCNQTSENIENPNDTVYKLIVQCQVIAACTQEYGISSLIKEWKATFKPSEWEKLYVIVEAEWVTRKMNSIAQCILPYMTDGLQALDQRLLIVTNISDIEGALHFLARIIQDRAAADLILTDQKQPRKHLSGQVDLLGPVMHDVIATNSEIKAEKVAAKCPY